MAAEDHLHAEIASLEKRLAELDAEREGLLASLEQLQLRYKAEIQASFSVSNIQSLFGHDIVL